MGYLNDDSAIATRIIPHRLSILKTSNNSKQQERTNSNYRQQQKKQEKVKNKLEWQPMVELKGGRKYEGECKVSKKSDNIRIESTNIREGNADARAMK